MASCTDDQIIRFVITRWRRYESPHYCYWRHKTTLNPLPVHNGDTVNTSKYLTLYLVVYPSLPLPLLAWLTSISPLCLLLPVYIPSCLAVCFFCFPFACQSTFLLPCTYVCLLVHHPSSLPAYPLFTCMLFFIYFPFWLCVSVSPAYTLLPVWLPTCLPTLVVTSFCLCLYDSFLSLSPSSVPWHFNVLLYAPARHKH